MLGDPKPASTGNPAVMFAGVALVLVIIAVIWYYSGSSTDQATEPAGKPQTSVSQTYKHAA